MTGSSASQARPSRPARRGIPDLSRHEKTSRQSILSIGARLAVNVFELDATHLAILLDLERSEGNGDPEASFDAKHADEGVVQD